MDNTEKKQSFFGRYKWYIIGLGAIILFNVFGSDKESSNVTYVEEEVLTPTQGVVTTVQETQAEIFKITDEQIVPTVDDSRIIAQYLDGGIDTFTLKEVALVDTTVTDRNDQRYRPSLLRSVVIGGMMGYMIGGRSMGSPLTRSSYANSNAYNKSNTAGRSAMRSTATRSTVRKPTTTRSRTGYGSGKSSRSYGG